MVEKCIVKPKHNLQGHHFDYQSEPVGAESKAPVSYLIAINCGLRLNGFFYSLCPVGISLLEGSQDAECIIF